MTTVGEQIRDNFEVVSSEHEIMTLNQLIQGADALIIIFVPFCYGEETNVSIETLVMDTNDRLGDFSDNDFRVVCITREPPSTIRHWAADRGLQLEIFSDGSLELSRALVGIFDLAMFIQATKDVHIGSYMVPMPGVVVLNSEGKVINKYIAPSPDAVHITVDDILKMSSS